MVSSFRFAALGLGLAFSAVTGCALVYTFSDYTAGTGGGGLGGAGGHSGTASQNSSGSGGAGSSSGSPSSSSVSSTGSSATSSASGVTCMMDPADPVDGDCHRDACMNGVLVTIVDDTDAPPKIDDKCTVDVCMMGVIMTKLVPPGSPCTVLAQSGQCCQGMCVTKELCNDGCRDFAETDIDCGGAACPDCGPGKHCTMDTDCVSGKCAPIPQTCQ